MLDCGHDGPAALGVCPHLLESERPHVERFTGRGTERELRCLDCAELAGAAVRRVCRACAETAREGGRHAIAGAPAVVEEPGPLALVHRPRPRRVGGTLLDVRPLPGGDRDRWLALADDGRLLELDLDRGTETVRALVPPDRLSPTEYPVTLVVSGDGRLAAVLQEQEGRAGLVLDLETGGVRMPLQRDEYHAEHCRHSFAFVEREGRTLIVHGTEWNRLDLHDPRTGELLTPRGPTRREGGPPPPHYLDYFHSGLSISPDGRWIADNGWVWQPDGVVAAWSLDRWLENVWESEDGPSRRALSWSGYAWDRPWCWVADRHLALWGYGDDDPLLDAVRIFDVATGEELAWFAGPRGELAFDGVLWSLDEAAGFAAWSVERGTRLLHDRRPAPRARFHPTARTLLSVHDGELCTSYPRGLDAAVSTGVIADLVHRIARERAFEDLPVLGDALESVGFADAEVLAHCQHPGEHGDRCWVLDRLAPPD